MTNLEKQLLESLKELLPYAIWLGDFIGNGKPDPTNPKSLGDRCDAIAMANRVIDKANAIRENKIPSDKSDGCHKLFEEWAATRCHPLSKNYKPNAYDAQSTMWAWAAWAAAWDVAMSNAKEESA